MPLRIALLLKGLPLAFVHGLIVTGSSGDEVLLDFV